MPLLGHLRSLVSGLPAEPTADLRLQRPDYPDAFYLLIFNDPAKLSTAYGLGWTVVAWKGSDQAWSVALDEHGVPVKAETHEAKRVAVAVLFSRGVRVEGWSDGFVGPLRMYRAAIGTQVGQDPGNGDAGRDPPAPG